MENKTNTKTPFVLSIISVIFCLSPIGLILSIIAINKYKKIDPNNTIPDSGKIISKVALFFSVVFTTIELLVFIIGFSCNCASQKAITNLNDANSQLSNSYTISQEYNVENNNKDENVQNQVDDKYQQFADNMN